VLSEWHNAKIIDILYVTQVPISVASKLLRPLIHNIVNGEKMNPPVTLVNPESLDEIK